MEYTVDCNRVIHNFIEYCIRKPPHEGSTIGFVDHCVHLGKPKDALNARIDSNEEVIAQPGKLFLVPGVSFVDVPLDLWGEDQFSGHAGFVLAAELLPS
jgi:hypothetical protein